VQRKRLEVRHDGQTPSPAADRPEPAVDCDRTRVDVMSAIQRFRRLVSPDRLSARDRRALRTGLILAIPILAWTFVVRPYREALADLTAQVEAERSLLAREEALLQSADVLPVRAGEAAAHAERVERRLVTGANVALVEGKVIAHLESLAQASRVLLQEIQGLQPVRSDAESEVVRPIRLAIEGESDLDGITRLLHSIEDSSMLLRIEELSVEPQTSRPESSGRGRNSEPQPEPRPTGVMQVSMIVVAFAPPDLPQGGRDDEMETFQ